MDRSQEIGLRDTTGEEPTTNYPPPSPAPLTEADMRRIAREEISKSIERMVNFAERLDDPTHPEGSTTTSDDGGNW